MERIGPSLILIALLAMPASACGDEGTRNRALAQAVARDFRKDCESADAPDAAMRRHLGRLCRCGEARIAATPIRWGETDAAINEKIHAAMDACYAEIGGAPGEGREAKGKAAAAGAAGR